MKYQRGINRSLIILMLNKTGRVQYLPNVSVLISINYYFICPITHRYHLLFPIDSASSAKLVFSVFPVEFFKACITLFCNPVISEYHFSI